MTACQHPGGCAFKNPAAFLLTFQTKPITGRHAAPGCTFTEGLCRACISGRSDQIRAEGGSLVDVKEIQQPPTPPAPIQADPVGLDAIDPPAAAPAAAEPFRPDWAVHPGEMLAELIEEHGLSVRLAATTLRWPTGTLQRVLDGRDDLTAGMAADIERAFGCSARLWTRLQEMYDSWKAKQPAGRA